MQGMTGITHLIPPSILKGSVAHKPKSRRYAYGATEWAILKAKADGKDGWDADLTCNADGTPVVNHGDKPLSRDSWFDPLGLIPETASIRKLTDAECARLRWRAPDGTLWPMLTAWDAMALSNEHGVIPCFEAKYDTGRDLFYQTGFWMNFKRRADDLRCTPIIMSLPGPGGVKGTRKLQAAHGVGLITMWLWRTGSSTPSTGIDLVKSHQKRPIYKVSSRAVGTTVFAPKEEEPMSPSKNSAGDVITEARSYVGFREGKSPGGSWNNDNPFAKLMGWANNQAWCASFVCAVFKTVGLLDLIRTPSAGVDQLSVGFKREKRWSEYPAIGAVVFYGRASDLNHTGIVYNYDDTHIYTIEGNTNSSGSPQGNGVYRMKRLRRSTNVVGYGYPDYKEGIDSADPDPKWKRKPVSPDRVEPAPVDKPNHVEQAQEHFKAGLALLAKVDDSRVEIKARESAIRAAVVKGPQS